MLYRDLLEKMARYISVSRANIESIVFNWSRSYSSLCPLYLQLIRSFPSSLGARIHRIYQDTGKDVSSNLWCSQHLIEQNMKNTFAATDGARTRDHMVKSHALYHLSYSGYINSSG